MAKSTLRNKILATKKTALKKIYVPEWETDIYIKELTVREQAQYEKGAFEDGGIKEDYYARYLIKAIVEEDGTPIFEDADFSALSEMPASVLLRIFREAMAIIPETKNSEADQPNTSVTN
jgi:hypothetical protein